MKRLRQRGFLLNPYRFAGTIQSGAFSADGVGGVTLVGASTAAAVASMDGTGALTFIGSTVQTASGAFSSDGVGAMSMVGASTASGEASSDGAGVVTFVSEPTALTVDAADFDPTNYLERASGMTGAADSKKGILSCWHRGRTDPAVVEILLQSVVNATGFTSIELGWYDGPTAGYPAGKYFRVAAANSSLAAIELELRTTSSLLSGTWRNILCSWDLATAGARHLYINDVSNLTQITFNNQTIDHSATDRHRVATGASLDGGLAELYFCPGQYLDFSVTSNRRKFITSGGKPVNLGATGEVPTGTVPMIYLHLDDGESANNFAINRTGNGNLTVSGVLTTFATSPSD